MVAVQTIDTMLGVVWLLAGPRLVIYRSDIRNAWLWNKDTYKRCRCSFLKVLPLNVVGSKVRLPHEVSLYVFR